MCASTLIKNRWLEHNVQCFQPWTRDNNASRLVSHALCKQTLSGHHRLDMHRICCQCHARSPPSVYRTNKKKHKFVTFELSTYTTGWWGLNGTFRTHCFISPYVHFSFLKEALLVLTVIHLVSILTVVIFKLEKNFRWCVYHSGFHSMWLLQCTYVQYVIGALQTH